MAIKVAAGYAIVGSLWIILSDRLVHHLIPDGDLEVIVSTGKGWFFIGATALLLWVVLDHYFREIRRSTRLLEESQRRWQFALDGAGHGVWDWNTQTNEVFFSVQFASMLGYSPEEFGHNVAAWESRVHPEDLHRVLAELHPHLEGRTLFYLSEHRVRCKDGSYKWVLDQGKVVTSTPEGKPLRVIGTHTDITGRKNAERNLAHLHRLHEHILHSAAEGILGLDSEGRHTFVNPAAARMLGYELEDLLGQNSHALWHHTRSNGQAYPEEACLIKATLDHGTYQHVSSEIFWRKDGTSFPVEYTSTPILEHDKVAGTVVTFSDITERKRSEQELQDSQNRLHEAIAAGNVGLWDWNLITNKVAYSAEWKQQLGYAESEVSDDFQEWQHRMHPDDLEISLKNVRNFIKSGSGHWETEFRMRHKNGTYHWILAQASLVKDESGHPVRMLGSHLDITMRKATEAALADEAIRRRILVEQSSDGIVVLDATGKVAEANQTYANMLGYSLEEMHELHVWDWDLQRSREELLPIIKALGPEGEHFETQQRRKDGSALDVEVSTNGALVNGQKLVFCVCRDISSRKKIESELRASEERFRTLVESAPTGIFVQVDARFAYVNAAAVQMFSASSPLDLIGQSVLDRFHPDYRALVRERIQTLNQDRRAVPPMEEKCFRLDGTGFEGEFTAAPFVHNGQPGALVFFRDISERKRLEAQFRQAQKLEAIGQLAGGVAHDFNNILAATMMHLGLLQMNDRLDADTRNSLKELEVETRRAATLTRQLLMFSRRSVLDVKPIDLNEVVANMLKMLTRLIGENIELRSEAQAGLPSIEADAGMLEQVLMNLVVNARDALPKGGRIIIRTSVANLQLKPDESNFERRPGRFVCLAIADNGSGIDAETLKHIFEPFFTTKEAGKGTGLGLATVHGIVAQHKGWVEVASKVGHGTTFRVLLPALVDPPAKVVETTDNTPLRRGRETILLVEDDTQVRLTVAQFLRVLGYRILEAATGQQAMAIWQTHGAEVDLLFTDMIMPEGITGLELTERLQRFKPNLRVIISSGYSAEIAQAGVPKKPGVIYLPKPHETKQLADIIRRCLDQPAAAQS